MMGSKVHIFRPITSISLENLVLTNHFYRWLDHILDFSYVRDLVKEIYTHAGRPSHVAHLFTTDTAEPTEDGEQ